MLMAGDTFLLFFAPGRSSLLLAELTAKIQPTSNWVYLSPAYNPVDA